MLKKMIQNVKKTVPLIHNITNNVTINDVANILLAAGGSPIMATDENEVEDLTAICTGLSINMGGLGLTPIESIIKAGKKSNELNHPVTLDPVAAGATKYRTDIINDLISEIKFTAIRGNISEFMALAAGGSSARGVDANELDVVTDENLQSVITLAKEYSKKTGAVIAISGAIDIICDDKKAYVARNGNPIMTKVTGSGCMLSALTAAYVSANPSSALDAAAAASIIMGIAGELGYEKMIETNSGISSFRNFMIDAIYNLDEDTLERRAKYEIY